MIFLLLALGLAQRTFQFISMVEHLPYGASMLQERHVARGTMGSGILVMAAGASIFAIGWWQKWTWLVETDFFITLVGWIMVILGFAFGVVGWVARHFSRKEEGK